MREAIVFTLAESAEAGKRSVSGKYGFMRRDWRCTRMVRCADKAIKHLIRKGRCFLFFSGRGHSYPPWHRIETAEREGSIFRVSGEHKKHRRTSRAVARARALFAPFFGVLL